MHISIFSVVLCASLLSSYWHHLANFVVQKFGVFQGRFYALSLICHWTASGRCCGLETCARRTAAYQSKNRSVGPCHGETSLFHTCSCGLDCNQKSGKLTIFSGIRQFLWPLFTGPGGFFNIIRGMFNSRMSEPSTVQLLNGSDLKLGIWWPQTWDLLCFLLA